MRRFVMALLLGLSFCACKDDDEKTSITGPGADRFEVKKTRAWAEDCKSCASGTIRNKTSSGIFNVRVNGHCGDGYDTAYVGALGPHETKSWTLRMPNSGCPPQVTLCPNPSLSVASD